MINKILIANRGEIAVRIIRTCKELGITAVAVYSDIDRKSPFVYLADEAWPLGGITSVESYLDGEKIIRIAKKSGCQAIHPGYGFLAENADFAEQVARENLIFIGPPARSIRIMGNKTAARALMQSHNVPTVPGTTEPISDVRQARETAARIGYPILIKAAAGGGGKGMRLVNRAEDFVEALEGASREAGSAFGDSSVYIEKFLEEPRHIEFQILADARGRTIHLGERECSIQRRHQKVIEEAPSAILTPELRQKMGQAAIQAAMACDYRNAGTIEFLVDKNLDFYFLEMNTRLQVEHPVTELVTGLDLVKEQIMIASGEPMSLDRSVECFWGHAVEGRIYAEDPDNAFAPSSGQIQFLKPADGPGIREDSGVTVGSEISLYYDPMISKLIAWGNNRTHAIERMIRALSEYEITGIQTTIPFLKKVLNHPAFRTAKFTTQFIDRYKDDLAGFNKESAELAGLLASIEAKTSAERMFQNNNNPNNGQPRRNAWKWTLRQKNLRAR